MRDEYRPFNHLYSISKDGKVLRLGEPYEPKPRKDGYFHMGRKQLLHRAIAHTWIRPIEKGEHVHHKNHDKSDNRADNLEIVPAMTHIRDRHAETVDRLKRSKMSDAAKKRQSERQKGRRLSDETKAKIGAAIKRLGIRPPVRYGPRPDWVVQNMLKNPPKQTPCIIHGIRYRTLKEAASATGIKWGTIRRRCHSPNFPEFQLVE
jgi:hypothetical protein